MNKRMNEVSSNHVHKACIISLMIQIGKYRRGCLLIPYPYIRMVRLVNVFNNPDYLGI